MLVIGPARESFALRHWDGDSFVAHPVNENAAEGSVSLVRFGGAAKGRFAEVTIEHLNAAGLGTFRRE